MAFGGGVGVAIGAAVGAAFLGGLVFAAAAGVRMAVFGGPGAVVLIGAGGEGGAEVAGAMVGLAGAWGAGAVGMWDGAMWAFLVFEREGEPTCDAVVVAVAVGTGAADVLGAGAEFAASAGYRGGMVGGEAKTRQGRPSGDAYRPKLGERKGTAAPKVFGALFVLMIVGVLLLRPGDVWISLAIAAVGVELLVGTIIFSRRARAASARANERRRRHW